MGGDQSEAFSAKPRLSLDDVRFMELRELSWNDGRKEAFGVSRSLAPGCSGIRRVVTLRDQNFLGIYEHFVIHARGGDRETTLLRALVWYTTRFISS